MLFCGKQTRTTKHPSKIINIQERERDFVYITIHKLNRHSEII